MEILTPTTITIGFCDWNAIKKIGNKYFVITTKPIFLGYYSLSPRTFQESRLYHFLTEKFYDQLADCFVEMDKISSISILTVFQYENYIKDRVPDSEVTYLTQTPVPDKPGYMYAIDGNGEKVPVQITERCGIRPCMFVDEEYLLALSPDDTIITITDIDFLPDKEDNCLSSVSEQIFEEHLIADCNEQEKDHQISIDEKNDEQNTNDLTSCDIIVSCETQQNSPIQTLDSESKPEDAYNIDEMPCKTKEINAFDGAFYDYAIIYDEGDDEFKTLLQQYGLVVDLFAKVSLNQERTEPSKQKNEASLRVINDKWRWKK